MFVERQTYRRRRLRDAARFLPVVGIVLFLVPLLWPQGGADGYSTSSAIQYLFLAWAGLVFAAFVLALYLRADTSPEDGEAPPDPDGAP